MGIMLIKEALDKLHKKWFNRTNTPVVNLRLEAEKMVNAIDSAKLILLDDASKYEYDRKLDKKAKQNYNYEGKLRTLFKKAQEKVNEGDYAGSINCIERAFELELNTSDQAEVWNFYAYINYLLEDIESTVYYFKKAIDLDPDCSNYCRMLGELYIECNNLVEAEKYIIKCNKIEPNNDLNLFAFASLLVEKQIYNKAISILEDILNAISYEDDFKQKVINKLSEAYTGQSVTMISHFSYKQAIEYANIAIGYAAKNYKAHAMKAFASFYLGKYEDTLNNMKIALSHESENISWHFLYGRALCKINRFKESLEVLSTLKGKMDNFESRVEDTFIKHSEELSSGGNNILAEQCLRCLSELI